ncbi:hypothetical protein ABNF65_18200 [Paenibacillus larvae]
MTRNDGNPKAYTKSAEFLVSYNWKGKCKDQIIQEMALPDYEQEYLDDAMKELAPKEKFTGMDLDEYFVLRMAMDEDDIGDIDDDDTIYRKRGEIE